MSFSTLFTLRRYLPALLALLPLLAQAQLSLTGASAKTENFDGMSTSATATAPSGIRLSGEAAPTYSSAANYTVTSVASNGGSTPTSNVSTGGTYNFLAQAGGSDRALGFLNSGSFGTPRSIMLAVSNGTSDIVQDLKVQFNLEKYRSGTREYNWTFYTSPDGSTWTAQPDGAQNYPADANNTTYFVPPGSVAKTVILSGVAIANGATYYLRWTQMGVGGTTGGATNGQAAGLDDVTLTPTLGGAAPTASIRTTAGTYASPYCISSTAGSASFSVAFASSNVTTGSTYAAQLSNASGFFSTDLTQNLIGSATSSPISAAIPAGTPSGSGYRIRVVSGTLASVNDNGTNLSINLAPTTNSVAVNPDGAQTFATNASGTALTATADVASTYAWFYGTNAGGPYATAISGATAAAYQPKGSDFPGPGTYYLVAQATSSSCGVVGTSAPVQLTITAAAAAFTLSATSLPDFGSLTIGSTSSVKSFTVSATTLSGPLVITPPAGFEIRTGATAFACCPIQLSPDANGNVPATTIDVRFAPLAAQAYNAQIALTTSGLPQQNVTVTGTGTTPIYPAAVASAAPTNIDKTFATSGGTVQEEGGSPVTARGVVYGFEADPTLSSGSVAAGSGLGTFTAQLTGLLPDSVYYVRAYATNALGTSYGEQFTFTTLAQPLDAEPAVTSTIAASNQRPTRVLLTLSGGQPGVKHLVLARLNGPVAVKPQDATAYSANATLGQGQLVGTASYVILSAAQDTVTVFGLRPNSPYSFAVYDYQDLSGTPYAQNYLTSAADSLTLTTPALPPTLLLREDFEYAAASRLTANGWTAHSGAGTNPVSVTTSGPTYADYSDGKGNAAALRASGEDVSRQFPTIYPRTAVYLSFVVAVSSVSTTGDYFLHLGPTTLGGNFRPRVFVRQAAAGNAIQFGVSGSGTPAYTSATYSLNTSYLLLVKYSFDETGNTTELYVNPSPSGGAYRVTATPDVTVSEAGSTSATDIGTLALRQGSSSPALVVDDIQLATAFPLTSTPLPVQLVSFTAQLTPRRNVQLTWATATEQQTDHFEVQRSADGRTFTTLSSQPAAGNSVITHTYQALDDALPAGLTTVYYRLKTVDTDGSVSYSPARSVALPTATGLALYPNPTRQATTLTGAAPQAAVQVFDALGRTLLTAQADATGTARLELPTALVPGVYIVRTGTQALRLVVE